jgi:hypothetical protein
MHWDMYKISDCQNSENNSRGIQNVGDEKTICNSLEKIMKLDPYIND